MTQKDPHAPLRDDVKLLGSLLGEALKTHEGEGIYEKVEKLRSLSKDLRARKGGAYEPLRKALESLSLSEARSIARSFAHFLNLANIAEQHHRVRRRRVYRRDPEASPQHGSCEETFKRLIEQGVAPERLHEAVSQLSIDLVLTAHPTEIARRTLLQEYHRIEQALALRDRSDLTPAEREEVHGDLKREIKCAWLTDEVRRRKPTPLDEAEGGLLIFEQTLLDTVPAYLREVDRVLKQLTKKGLAWDSAPVRFGSWMGGDRDGNPNVTPDITRRATLLSRWIASGLYFDEIVQLRRELSVNVCGKAMRARVGDGSREPYRDFLREVRDRMARTRDSLAAQLLDEPTSIRPEETYRESRELIEPLLACRESLIETKAQPIADGRVLDLLRRLATFGLTLVRLDLRQESNRHAEAIDHVTRYLGLGSYLEWDEEKKQEFLIRELQSKRPLIPASLPVDEKVQDVLDTFRVVAGIGRESLGAYVISMARAASDVLAVELLQKETGIAQPLPVSPLFETAADLDAAPSTMRGLFEVPWYREHLRAHHGDVQQVMLGYSDSAKDAGRLTANWELYKVQERLEELCRSNKIELNLFHGRGGSAGRGGVPTYLAILSQPPGTVQGKLRVTEQGEMIQSKFGIARIAERTLEVYTAATLHAWLKPPAGPRAEWRAMMEELSGKAMKAYRGVVREDPRFIQYFRQATPERELGELNIGSRPASRKKDGGLESLRAIPWVFAWTQNRLILPAWLGFGDAIDGEIAQGKLDTLRAMYRDWPFFQVGVDMVEMVLAKADAGIAASYDERLVSPELRPLGEELGKKLALTEKCVLQVSGHSALLEKNPILRRSIDVRNPYVDPINLIQTEMLYRLRTCGSPGAEACDPLLRETLLVTFNGVAAGMRNTG